MLSDFIVFLKKFGVIGLALGVVMGGAVKTLSDSLVANIINPILSKIVGESQLSEIQFWDIQIGAFLNDLIGFIVLMFVVYYSVKIFIARFLSEGELEKFKS